MPTKTSPTLTNAFCQRLQLIALALMIGQFVYLFVGWPSSHGRAAGTMHDGEHVQLIIQVGFVVGIVLIAASFLATRRPATGLAEHSKRFFVGFAVAEAGALIGLLLCFLFGTFTPLLVLAVATAASIYAHYLSITRRIRQSPELNQSR